MNMELRGPVRWAWLKRNLPRPLGYLGLFAIAGMFYAIARLFPVESMLRAIASVPSAGALVYAVWQIFRDATAFERTAFLQRQQEVFSVGATSHMAVTAFDRHVAFSQEYLEEMQETLATLFRLGPNEEVLKHARALQVIRRKHVLWITNSIAKVLDPFEAAVREIGAGAHYVEATRLSINPGDSTRRSEMIQNIHDRLLQVLGMGGDDVPPNPDQNGSEVMARLRDILGIEELTEMRVALIRRALEGSAS